MTITKIRYGNNKVHIEYLQANQNNDKETDEVTLTTSDPPRPEFDNALQALKPHLLECLEMSDEYGDNLTITGLTITHKAGSRSVVIVGKKTLQNSNSPFNIATPGKLDTVKDEDSDGANCLPQESVKAIDLIIDEAEEYIKGNRLQSTLKLEGSASDKKKKS